jgi:hypothetical protein
MFELDHAKDQTMTVLKLALANLVMWTRDTYFSSTYAQAAWHRLAPFFRGMGFSHITGVPYQKESRET